MEVPADEHTIGPQRRTSHPRERSGRSVSSSRNTVDFQISQPPTRSRPILPASTPLPGRETRLEIDLLDSSQLVGHLAVELLRHPTLVLSLTPGIRVELQQPDTVLFLSHRSHHHPCERQRTADERSVLLHIQRTQLTVGLSRTPDQLTAGGFQLPLALS